MDNKFALFYIKNDTLYPVLMSQEEFETLQVIAPAIFNNKQVTVIDEPVGKVKELVKRVKND